jgi:phosphoribosylamine--glycine ligase
MGAYSPVPDIGPGELENLVESIHRPVVAELARRSAPYIGVLYAGLIMTDSGPRVLEFNCRFGDPETQAIVPLLQGDLLVTLAAAANGRLKGIDLTSQGAAVTVAVTAGAYPAGNDTGSPITGIADAEASGALVFHAGTAKHGSQIVTSGGRILNVTGIAPSLGAARTRAYDAVAMISFDGARHRTDIAAAATAQEAHATG